MLAARVNVRAGVTFDLEPGIRVWLVAYLFGREESFWEESTIEGCTTSPGLNSSAEVRIKVEVGRVQSKVSPQQSCSASVLELETTMHRRLQLVDVLKFDELATATPTFWVALSREPARRVGGAEVLAVAENGRLHKILDRSVGLLTFAASSRLPSRSCSPLYCALVGHNL